MLGGEVGVPAVGPHVTCVEAAVEVFAVEIGRGFGGFLVRSLGSLVFCSDNWLVVRFIEGRAVF